MIKKLTLEQFKETLLSAEQFIRDIEEINVEEIKEKADIIESYKSQLIKEYDELVAVGIDVSSVEERYSFALSNLACYLSMSNSF